MAKKYKDKNKKRSDRKVLLSENDIAKIVKKQTDKQVLKMFEGMIMVTMLSLKDTYGFGQKRLFTVASKIVDNYGCIDDGLLNYNDLKKWCEEEVKIKIDLHNSNISTL